MLIPRLFHQIWVGPDPVPEEYELYQQSWLAHHPGWELQVWREETLPELGELHRPEAFERLRAPAERVNILRLEVLWRFGGVYMDTDFECLRPIEPLIEEAEIFVGYRKPGIVNNALMGCVPNHPALEEALAAIQPREFFGHDKDATGSKPLQSVLERWPAVTYLEPRLLYPRTPEDLEHAHAIHHQARTWKDAEGLRRSLRKAERRLLDAQDEARQWRRRYEEAEAELRRVTAR